MSLRTCVSASSMGSSVGTAPPLLDGTAAFPSSDIRVTSPFAGAGVYTSRVGTGPSGGSLYPFIGDRLVSSASLSTPVASVLPSVATTDCLIHRIPSLSSASPSRASEYARMFLHLPFPELVLSIQRLLHSSVPELLGPHLRAGASGSEFLDETFEISHRNFHFASYFYCNQLFSLYNESIMAFANIV